MLRFKLHYVISLVRQRAEELMNSEKLATFLCLQTSRKSLSPRLMTDVVSNALLCEKPSPNWIYGVKNTFSPNRRSFSETKEAEGGGGGQFISRSLQRKERRKGEKKHFSS